ncbi:rhomboid family intramembrane serine protease [Salinarimonas soli]|uniref:Rhomboid family intramembrane serine protease n=2 Tax=Salinarimonas soli TaxID=1638099 RepID=A0A5B2V9G6_9HYPH|nr:rhomboid family intramembrane serine protease [Salinarimonas soli]
MRFVRAPFVTRAILAACILVHLAIVSGLLPLDVTWIYAGLGLIPSVLLGTEALPDGLPLVPAPLTLATSLFLHATWLHLVGNMLFLWVFGDNVEDALGHGRFLLFYVLCGIGAGLAHALLDPGSIHPLIGASGAVSGVVAAYVMLHPRVQVWGLFLKGIPLRLRASWAISVWVLFQIGAAFLGGDESVGWFAHLGGLGVGAALILVMRRPGVLLFGRA